LFYIAVMRFFAVTPSGYSSAKITGVDGKEDLNFRLIPEAYPEVFALESGRKLKTGTPYRLRDFQGNSQGIGEVVFREGRPMIQKSDGTLIEIVGLILSILRDVEKLWLIIKSLFGDRQATKDLKGINKVLNGINNTNHT